MVYDKMAYIYIPSLFLYVGIGQYESSYTELEVSNKATDSQMFTAPN